MGRYDAPVDFRIAQQVPDSVPPELRQAFADVFDALQQIIYTLVDECGIGSQNRDLWEQLAGSYSTVKTQNLGRLYVIAGESIQGSAMVNFYNDLGVLKVRNANATNNTRPAQGFSNTEGLVNTGEILECIVGSGIVTISGLVLGDKYYLSTSNGQIANGPAVAGGNIEQYLGFAIDSNHAFVSFGYWIQH